MKGSSMDTESNRGARQPDWTSRRDALKRGAIVGGLVWVAPAFQLVGISSAHAQSPSSGPKDLTGTGDTTTNPDGPNDSTGAGDITTNPDGPNDSTGAGDITTNPDGPNDSTGAGDITTNRADRTGTGDLTSKPTDRNGPTGTGGITTNRADRTTTGDRPDRRRGGGSGERIPGPRRIDTG
ncbi:MAG: hypothetical protein KY452_12950, partial [Actinobacteria bacterium]|nr:hypothetical protein [Actinomycetota bacterium]